MRACRKEDDGKIAFLKDRSRRLCARTGVDVADTGPGLAETVGSRLFEPFTTTKPQGLGVGLSISRSIIEEHHGKLWAEDNPAGGTTFSFVLPVARV
jgi:signal transduction histidine kinase